MNAATWPSNDVGAEKLLVLDPLHQQLRHLQVRDLPGLFQPGDLLVANDAAVLPASLRVVGHPSIAELRLASLEEDGQALVVLMGAGDWHTPTEQRPDPGSLPNGAVLNLAGGLWMRVTGQSTVSHRLVHAQLGPTGDAFWGLLYRHGAPIQYAYLQHTLPQWHVHNAYAARPWAVELPSAGRVLSWEMLRALEARQVDVAVLTHAAGLSSTGDAALDAVLPLPERYEIPEATVAAIQRCNARGGRVVAVGTSVMRALEDSAVRNAGSVVAGRQTATLRLGPHTPPRVVDGILSGMHEPGSSHMELLHALAPHALLQQAHREAVARGYLVHEFGDHTLVLPGCPLVTRGRTARLSPLCVDGHAPAPGGN